MAFSAASTRKCQRSSLHVERRYFSTISCKDNSAALSQTRILSTNSTTVICHIEKKDELALDELSSIEKKVSCPPKFRRRHPFPSKELSSIEDELALDEEECPTRVVSLNLPWLSKELSTIGDDALLLAV